MPNQIPQERLEEDLRIQADLLGHPHGYKVHDALIKGQDLGRAMRLAAESNDEELVSKFTLAAIHEEMRYKNFTLAAAAEEVFYRAIRYLESFQNSPNSEIPRRAFAGFFWGILKLKDRIVLNGFVHAVITMRRLPPFMYVTGGKAEAQIQDLVRKWALENPAEARNILTRSKELMEAEKQGEPTPLGRMTAEAIFYALIGRLDFYRKIGLTIPA